MFNTPLVSRRRKAINGFENASNDLTLGCTALDEIQRKSQGGDAVEQIQAVQCSHPYPMVLPHPVYLICIGNDEFTYEKRMRPIPQKDVLKKHVETHFRLPEYQQEFEYCHPKYSIQLESIMHFKRHAYNIHGVSY